MSEKISAEEMEAADAASQSMNFIGAFLASPVDFEAQLTEKERLQYLINLRLSSAFFPTGGEENLQLRRVLAPLNGEFPDNDLWAQYAALRGNFREGVEFDS